MLSCDHVCTTNTLQVTFTGAGNLTNQAPVFADAGRGDFHLAPGSPGIDDGVFLSWMAAGATDLDGLPRVDRITGRVDLGAFEHHPRGCTILIR